MNAYIEQMDNLQKRPLETLERFNPSTPGVSQDKTTQLEDQGQYSIPHLGPIYTSSDEATGGARTRTGQSQQQQPVMPAGGTT